MVVKVKERVEEQQQKLLELQRQEAPLGERPGEAYIMESWGTCNQGSCMFRQMKYGKLNSPSMEERCIMKQFLPKHGLHMYCWNIMFIMVLDLHSIFDDANRWTPRKKRKIFTHIQNRMLCNVVFHIYVYIHIDVTIHATTFYAACFLSFWKPHHLFPHVLVSPGGTVPDFFGTGAGLGSTWMGWMGTFPICFQWAAGEPQNFQNHWVTQKLK